MPHHWRPSDHLERSPRSGTWLLVRRGVQLGAVEYGRVRGRQAFRAVTPSGQIVGYSWSLERACDRLWEWCVRTGRGAALSAWPWPPIQIGDSEWIIMRNSPSLPKAVVRLVAETPESPRYYRAVTWAPASDNRALIGYFPTLEAADEAVLEDSPGRIVTTTPHR